MVIYDHTIPFGVLRQYKAAENGTEVVGGVTYPATSMWSNTSYVAASSVVVTGHQWTICDPVDPAGPGSMNLHRVSVSGSASSTDVALDTSLELDQEERQSQFLAFGRTRPITVRGEMYDEAISSAGLALLFQGKAEWDNFNAIRRRRVPVILRSDMGEVFCVVLGAARPGALLRATDRVTNPYRVTVTAVTATDMPTVPMPYSVNY
jgi:hypothetical protein